MPKFGFKTHNLGDVSLVLTDYETGSDGVIMTQPFANPAEVEQEFAKLDAMLKKAKKKALQMVTPDEQGVSSAHRTFANVLKKADPR
ncbi:MAG: hypothetical protein ABR589_07605 [Chthoniobacterales bacterium]